jgi:hypothetical protein
VTRWFFVIIEHGEAAARDLHLSLDGLVRVGDTADRDRLRLPLRREQLLAQQLRRVLLHHDLGLEIEAGREAEVLVRRPREAVSAAVLAAAIRIDAVGEADVRRVIAGDDRTRRIAEVDGARNALVALRVVVDDVRQLLEAILGIPARTSSANGAHLRNERIADVKKIYTG